MKNPIVNEDTKNTTSFHLNANAAGKNDYKFQINHSFHLFFFHDFNLIRTLPLPDGRRLTDYHG
jgi:hypothetical protein